MTYYLTQLNDDIFGIWEETEDPERFKQVKDFTSQVHTQYAHRTFIKNYAVASAGDVNSLIGLLAMEKL